MTKNINWDVNFQLMYDSLYFEKFGNPKEVIKKKKKVLPILSTEEVAVEMAIVPINPSDLIPVTGAYRHRIKVPSTPGYEGVGVIKYVGNERDKCLIGKRVLPIKGEGTWQEIVITNKSNLIFVPDDIEDKYACQAYINPITAWLICTREIVLKENDFLVVNACNSSLGKIFIQISKILDFKIIAIIRSGIYKQNLNQLGADFVIDSSEEDVLKEVMRLTNNRGAEVAVDLIGSHPGTILASCVKKGGQFITVGLLSGIQVDWKLITTTYKISAKVFHLRHWLNKSSDSELKKMFQNVFFLMQQKKLLLLEPQVIFPLDQYNQAIMYSVDLNIKNKVFLAKNDFSG